MPGIPARLLLGLVLSLALGSLAYRRRSLSASGVAGMAVIGTLVFGFGGWVWAGTLVAFFVTSSMLSHYGQARKEAVAEKFAKGARRDLGQTLANGGVPALLALGAGLSGRVSPSYPVLALAFFSAIAAVNADTWATEIGVLAPTQPRLITTGRRVPEGTSGGITLLGTGAALAGSTFIGLVAFVLVQGAAWVTTSRFLLSDWVLIPVAAFGGLLGSLFDSLLGATVQAIYRCPVCGVETEHEVHRCGSPTEHVRGWRWLNNDWVNFFCSLAGAACGALSAILIF